MDPKSVEALDEYEKCLSIVESYIKSFTQKPREEMIKNLTPFEKTKLDTTMAYALLTLELCYSRSKGEKIDDHNSLMFLESIRTNYNILNSVIDRS